MAFINKKEIVISMLIIFIIITIALIASKHVVHTYKKPEAVLEFIIHKGDTILVIREIKEYKHYRIPTAEEKRKLYKQLQNVRMEEN